MSTEVYINFSLFNPDRHFRNCDESNFHKQKALQETLSWQKESWVAPSSCGFPHQVPNLWSCIALIFFKAVSAIQYYTMLISESVVASSRASCSHAWNLLLGAFKGESGQGKSQGNWSNQCEANILFTPAKLRHPTEYETSLRVVWRWMKMVCTDDYRCMYVRICT